MDFASWISHGLVASYSRLGILCLGLVLFIMTTLTIVELFALANLFKDKRSRRSHGNITTCRVLRVLDFMRSVGTAVRPTLLNLGWRDRGASQACVSASRDRARVLLCGLDNAGKTTLCRLLTRRRGWPSRQPRPEHHVLHHNIRWQDQDFHFIDPSDGEARHRNLQQRLWQDLLDSRPDAIIFMVDASDVTRHASAREDFHRILRHPSICKLPVLVLGTKIDHATAVDTWELKRSLGLAGLSSDQREALLGQTLCLRGMPYELRHRIAGFYPEHPPASPYHRGPLAVHMCTLKTEASLEIGLKWLSEQVYQCDQSSKHQICRLLSSWVDKLASLARCLTSSRALGRQVALLPLYQA